LDEQPPAGEHCRGCQAYAPPQPGNHALPRRRIGRDCLIGDDARHQPALDLGARQRGHMPRTWWQCDTLHEGADIGTAACACDDMLAYRYGVVDIKCAEDECR
jgi:hypothetical protein